MIILIQRLEILTDLSKRLVTHPIIIIIIIIIIYCLVLCHVLISNAPRDKIS